MRFISQNKSRQIDQNLLEIGFTLEQLIETAGLFAFEVILHLLDKKQTKILILIGPGNNGADGLVIARWLAIVGHKVSILVKSNKYENLIFLCKNVGVNIYDDIPNFEYDIIIDAIFGFSFRPPFKEPYYSILDYYKEHPKIISVDVPSSFVIDGKMKIRCLNLGSLFLLWDLKNVVRDMKHI